MPYGLPMVLPGGGQGVRGVHLVEVVAKRANLCLATHAIPKRGGHSLQHLLADGQRVVWIALSHAPAA